MEDTRYVGGVQKLGRRIATIRAAFSLPVLTDQISDLLVRRAKDRFEKQQDPDGKMWTPLAATTLARRRRAGGIPGRKILSQTNELRDSIRAIKGALGGIFAVNTGAGVRIGFVGGEHLQLKARAHSYGNKKRGLPQRRILGVGAADVKAVDGLLRRVAAKMED
jgi:phage gpG-like protein